MIDVILGAIQGFYDKGGVILYPLTLVIFTIWLIAIERFLYIRRVHYKNVAEVKAYWENKPFVSNWCQVQIRNSLMVSLRERLRVGLPTVRALVTICPLLGLLGTVVGMISVFEIMAQGNSGSPRAMASGISLATIPTMAGMIGAISGFAIISVMESRIAEEEKQLDQKLKL